MGLNEAIVLFNNGNMSVFDVIWNNIVPCIRWFKYTDPRGCYTIDDFKQECAINLYKKMKKWDSSRGDFKKFAIFITYRHLITLVYKLYNSTNLYRKNQAIKGDNTYVNKFMQLKEDSSTIEDRNYVPMEEIVCSYFKEPIVRDIFNYLIKEEDVFYSNTRQKDKSTLYHIADKHHISISEIKKIIDSKRNAIAYLIG